MPAKTRGGGRKIVPDRAVSLLKWRITHNPSAPLPNSASKYNQCRVKGQDKFLSQAKIFGLAAIGINFVVFPVIFGQDGQGDQSSVISDQSTVITLARSLITDH